jgi:hypothetical protein
MRAHQRAVVVGDWASIVAAEEPPMVVAESVDHRIFTFEFQDRPFVSWSKNPKRDSFCVEVALMLFVVPSRFSIRLPRPDRYLLRSYATPKLNGASQAVNIAPLLCERPLVTVPGNRMIPPLPGNGRISCSHTCSAAAASKVPLLGRKLPLLP